MEMAIVCVAFAVLLLAWVHALHWYEFRRWVKFRMENRRADEPYRTPMTVVHARWAREHVLLSRDEVNLEREQLALDRERESMLEHIEFLHTMEKKRKEEAEQAKLAEAEQTETREGESEDK